MNLLICNGLMPILMVNLSDTVKPKRFNLSPEAVSARRLGIDVVFIGPGPTINGYVMSQTSNNSQMRLHRRIHGENQQVGIRRWIWWKWRA
jgi:hypothetical protein